MDEKKLRQLMNRLTVRRCVNWHADGKPWESETINDIIKRIAEMKDEVYCIAVDIKIIPEKDERQQVIQLRDIINEEMAKKRFQHWIHGANSIDHLLHQLNERLEDPALLIFHQFTSPDDEKEKNLLRSIRKFIRMRDSLFLGMLLFSSQRLYKWDLRPESDMDERVVEFFPQK